MSDFRGGLIFTLLYFKLSDLLGDRWKSLIEEFLEEKHSLLRFSVHLYDAHLLHDAVTHAASCESA